MIAMAGTYWLHFFREEKTMIFPTVYLLLKLPFFNGRPAFRPQSKVYILNLLIKDFNRCGSIVGHLISVIGQNVSGPLC